MQMVQPPVGGFPQGSPMVAGPPPTQTTPARPLLQQPLLHDNRPPGTGDSPVVMPPASVMNMTTSSPNLQGGMALSGVMASQGGVINQGAMLQGGMINQGSAVSQANASHQGGVANQGGMASQEAVAVSTSAPSEPGAASSALIVEEKKSEEVKKKRRRKKKVPHLCNTNIQYF